MHRKSVYPVYATALLLFAILTVGTSSLSRAAENDLQIATFAGGSLENPTYKQVSAGGTGYREAVQIFYDPKKVSYAMLLDVLWHSVDPTDGSGQFCDRGESYGTAIFANSPEQKRLAEDSKRKLQAFSVLKQPIVTPIEVAGPFYPAEDYHQDYYKKSSIRYKIYRYRCGRDTRIKELWGKDAHQGIAEHLAPCVAVVALLGHCDPPAKPFFRSALPPKANNADTAWTFVLRPVSIERWKEQQ